MKTTKTLILLLLTSILFTSCNQQKENEYAAAIINKNAPAKITANPMISFSETEFDFGTIAEGDIVKHSFSFTNTGNAPLVITNAKGSCGCTVPEWPKEPIAPGATKELKVVFNSKNKPNLQSKQVTITSNTATGKDILKIKAMVTPNPKKTAKTVSSNK